MDFNASVSLDTEADYARRISMNVCPIRTIDAISMPVAEILMDHTLARVTAVTVAMVSHVLISTNVPTVTTTVT